MKVLIVMPFKDKHKELMAQTFPQVEFIYERNPEKNLVESVEVIIGNVKPSLLKDAKNLKWLQLNSAGTDGYCEKGILPSRLY